MKRKLLLAALCVVGAVGMRAQTDVTDTYLVNPSFETLKASDGTTDVTVKTKLTNGLYGWTIDNSSMSDYQLESAASGSSSGFVNGGSITATEGTYYYFNRKGWGNLNTTLSTTTKADVTAGTYYLVFDYKAADYSNNNNASKNGTTIGITVTDASSNTLATLPATKKAYSITNEGSNPGTDAYMANAPWSKMGVAFVVETASTLTFAVQQNMVNSGRSDIIYDNFKLYKIDDASDIDFTGYIANPSFEAGNTNGWTVYNANDTGAKLNSNATYTTTGADGNYVFNTWGGSADKYVRQTINGLPEGYYSVKALIASDANVNITLYAGDSQKAVTSSTDGKGVFVEGTTDAILVSDGATLEIGTTSTNWYKTDKFRLFYYDPIISGYAARDLAALVSKAATYEGKIPTAAYDEINSVVTTYNQSYTDFESYKTAFAAINTAISTYGSDEMIAAYAEYLIYKNGMDAVAVVTTTDATTAASRKSTYLDPIASEGEDATTVVALTTAKANVKTAVLNYIKKLTPADAENAPFDLTFMITNPSFSANTMTGWTGTTPNFGNDATQKAAYACEYYEKEFDIYQSLTDMVTGNYRLKVKAYQRPGGSGDIVPAYVNAEDKKDGSFGTTSEIYVNGGNEASQAIKNAASPMITAAIGVGNESSVEVSGTTYYIPNDMVSAVAYFNAGKYENEAEILATTSTITFGFRSTANHVSYDWTIFDDFRLYYTGQLDLSVFQTSLDAKVYEANTAKTNLTGKIPTAALDVLQTAIEDNDNDDNAFEDEEQFTEAIANISAAITTAQSLATYYAAYQTGKATALAIKAQDVWTDKDDAEATFDGVVADADDAVDEATTVEAITMEGAKVLAALKVFIGAVDINADEYFDLTGLITNAGMDAVAGWSGTTPTINVSCAEFYNVDFDFNQTITSMPAGNYELHVQAFQRPGGYGSISANDAINAFIYINSDENSTTVKNVMSESSSTALYSEENKGAEPYVGPYDYSADGKYYPNGMTGARRYFDANYYENVVLTGVAAGDLKFGFKCTNHAQSAWTLFDNFRLYYYGTSISITIDEDVDFNVISDINNANITLNRTIKADIWNTITLPFDIDNTELKAKFGDDVAIAEYSEEAVGDNSTVNFNTMGTPAITANTPVLLKTSTAGSSYSFSEKTIKAGTAKVAGSNNFDFVGTYAASFTIAEGDYYIGNNELWKSDGAATIKGTRAYIKAKSAEAKIRLVIDGKDATAIEAIEITGSDVENGNVYDMSGRLVKNPVRGLYIKNGKKVFVK